MATTNHDRVSKALELLRTGLAPFVQREFENLFKGKALDEARRFVPNARLDSNKPFEKWDAAVLLQVMWEAWRDVFDKTLGQADRTYVSELRTIRNKLLENDRNKRYQHASELVGALEALPPL
jgi:hypothetical protein